MSNKDMDYRFFLAHDKATPDEKINEWRDTLTELLGAAYPDHNVTVVAGRDDYRDRAKDAGGWKGWPISVVSGALWDGTPRFHGIIRPARLVGTMDTVLGKPTYEMIEGFLREGKMVWVWDVKTGKFSSAWGVKRLPGDDFKSWGRAVVRAEGE